MVMKLTNKPLMTPIRKPPKTTKKKERNGHEYFCDTNTCHIKKSNHGIVKYNCNTIIEEGLSKHKEVEAHVHLKVRLRNK